MTIGKTYVMSDIHGCWDKYKRILEKIKLGTDDRLFILGDVIDREEFGIELLLDIRSASNIILLLGNHEAMAIPVLKSIRHIAPEEKCLDILQGDELQAWKDWTNEGGFSTQKTFLLLSVDERTLIIDYLESLPLYKELVIDDKNFVLVHAGLHGFLEEKRLDEYTVNDLVWDRCDYDKVYFKDKYLVTGHTPTFIIKGNNRDKIYRKNNHIAVDCGAVYGKCLACLCLDTMEEFYA